MKPLSLRARVQLLLLVGAVLPLALVGLWLVGTTGRAGRTLLQRQLDSAVVTMSRQTDARWSTREGELALLAGNQVVAHALDNSAVAPPSRDDAAYLDALTDGLSVQIPDVSYTTSAGAVWWSKSRTADAAREGRTDGSAAAEPRLIHVDQPIKDSAGRVIGALHATVRMAGLMAGIQDVQVVPGGVLSVLTRGDAAQAPPAGWLAASEDVDGPGIRLALQAPAETYVTPFASAARRGLSVLAIVALLALIASGAIATRLTSSLDRLAAAADSVASGNLEREVRPAGPPEVVRVGEAFNAMTQSLRSTLVQLSRQQSLAAVGEFAASLSHEVRNSLTAIRVDLQHATRHLPEDNQGTALVARTLGTVRRLDSTVTGALRVARSGKAPQTRVALRDILARAMHAAEPAFVLAGGELLPLTGDGAAVELECDAGALEQLFLNLLLNAAQALAAGGTASVNAMAESDRVLVYISDTGPGIGELELAHVGTVLETSKPHGTGLGLPIARRIAEAHGGSVTLDSAPGRGTVVCVSLRRAGTGQATGPSTGPITGPITGSEHLITNI